MMSPRFRIAPYTLREKRMDASMHLLMRLLSPRGESPQLTHWWNNLDVPPEAARALEPDLMPSVLGDPRAPQRRGVWDLRFHLGWWAQYVVLKPVEYQGHWHLGWSSPSGTGVSQLSFDGSVRALIGPNNVAFFGIAVATQRQIKLQEVGRGRLGDMGPFRQVPLL